MVDLSKPINRRSFVTAAGCGLGVIAGGFSNESRAAAVAESVEYCDADEVQWHHASDIGVEGQGWSGDDLEDPYDRLPARAKQTVRPPVWGLSKNAAGLSFRFRTNASTIHCRYTLRDGGLAMYHMPATGVSGVDLYGKAENGDWQWVAVSRPVSRKATVVLADGLLPGTHEFMAYFPLYNGMTSLEIGVPKDALFEGISPRNKKPIVFYGTSVLQGGCASRPGMVFTSILDRRLGWPAINLGFSGNGKMESEVGVFLAEIDAAAYVIDCCPNMNGGEVAQRCEPLVKQLCNAHPDVPVLLVEDRVNSNASWFPARLQHHRANHQALRSAYDQLTKAGEKKLFYLGAENLLGDDNEATVDGSHPTDLGMMRYADAYEPVLREMLAL